MAVTRIKNNQITDASAGNTQLGVNAAVKLQNYSVTAGKLANSLVYGSDLTVSGNLTVNGTTTTVDTINTLIKDPILTLADGQTAGTPTVDIGLLGLRGNQLSSFIGWNEANTQFAAVLSNTTASNTTVNITQYADFKAANILATGNLSVAGNIIGNVNFSGNISAGNLLTSGVVSATGTITGGNLATGGTVSATGTATLGNVATGGTISATANITGGNLLTGGLISATSNITGGNLLTGGIISSTGNLTAGNISTAGNVTASYFIGNISGNIDAAGSNTQIQFNTAGDILGANANFTYDYATNLMTVNGGNIVSGNLSATGNAVAGNVLTGGLISATGNITGGNANIIGTVNAGTGSTNYIQVFGSSDNPVIRATGAANVGLMLSSAGTGGYIFNNGNSVTLGTSTGFHISPVTGSNYLQVAGASSGNAPVLSAQGSTDTNVNITLTPKGTGNVNTGANVSATGNVTGGNILTGGLISAGGNITSTTNVNTPNVVGASGLSLSTSGNANINIEPAGTGNIVVNNRYINGLQLTPLQDADAASKYYVDTIATTGLTFHEAVFATTNTTLASATGGTITYTQPNGVSNGIGAYISTTGTFTTIDTANVQTVGTRILVKNEANAVLNGVYTYTNATSITRSTDTDQYGAQSTESFSINDYFFTTNGNINSGAAFVVDAPAGVITFGTSNISFAQFSSSQTYTANNSAGLTLVNQQFNAKVDNNTTAFDGGGNISVKAGANLTTPNIGAATGTSLSVTGDVTANTNISAVGNVIGGNVSTAGLISATGNVTGGNVLTGGLISATGNLTSGNVNTGNISLSGNVISALNVTGNIAGGNLLTGGLISATGNVTGGNVLTGGLISATGNATAGNVLTGGLISATGNVTGGNVLFGSGIVSGTGNITGGNLLTGGLISATGNIYGGNVSTAGNVTASYFIGNISGNIDAAGSNTQIQFNGPGDILAANANFTYDYATNLMTVNGGNINTGNLSATGNAVAANAIATTGGYFGNIVISGDNITDTNGRVNFNTAVGDVDFAVNGLAANVFYVDAGANTASFGNSTQYTNAIVSFNSTTSIKLPLGSTATRPSNASSTTGMLRFNTTDNGLELFDNSEWVQVGGTTFTVISDEQFNGDGSTVAFTLGSSQTTNSCLVSINGVVQIPGSAYSVSGTDPTCVLTFTEAPAAGDLIDVREITTTTTTTALSNSSGNAEIVGNSVAAQFDITGNLIPVGPANTQTLGSATNYWKSLYVSGNTLYLGGLQLKEASANTFAVYTADGVTQANIDVGSIDVTSIQQGNTTIGIATPNGNAYIQVGGSSNTAVWATTGQYITGIISATGNITGNYILGNGSQLTGIDATSIQSGTSNVRVVSSGGNVATGVGGTANVIVAATTGQYVTGVVSATGNITGSYILGNGSQLTGIDATSIQNGTSNVKTLASGNVTVSVGGTSNVSVYATTGQYVTGVVSASGNITASNVLTGGIVSATGNITAGNLSVGNGTVTLNNIVNNGANGAGNIGSSTTYFNTVFAKATSAQYADLAEKYVADAEYAPGTVLSFGGEKEVTRSARDADRAVAGVVSTNPSYIMNAGLEADHVATIALTGRVPTSVTGTVAKGDLMVSNGDGTARAEQDPRAGAIIGKALENFEGDAGVIEVVIGRF